MLGFSYPFSFSHFKIVRNRIASCHFSSSSSSSATNLSLTKLLSLNTNLSRRELERMVGRGEVSLRGAIVQSSIISQADWKDVQKSSAAIKVQGKSVLITQNKARSENAIPRVWAVNKLPGEVVTEADPQGRLSMIDRLRRGGVGKGKKYKDHLKPIGRLDIPTEGLILVTNDGDFAREMELPSNAIHRVYRARVHGRLNSYKLDRIRNGFDSYKPMKVSVEKRHKRTKLSANTWVQITASEGQNRQIRNVFQSLALNVTRLIRIAYGDYNLHSIPPGLAIPVPCKPVDRQKAKGSLRQKKKKSRQRHTSVDAPTVRWAKSSQQ